jgi:3'-phosphoadenosine 5'-phosphosulfate sulfotransferase (PAPS reductase)/FAD synthetase
MKIVAFSGGKDSTAMALRMAELGEDFTLLFTPAGNEPPELFIHIQTMVERMGKPLVTPPNKSLDHWINFYNALPSWRMRWCTRQIKIEPCIAYLKEHPESTLCVGLRADEEAREGLYGNYATYRYPLREWGWDIKKVQSYLSTLNVKVPKRTNCMLCYDQQLREWYELWRDRPDEWERGKRYEEQTGHTFRSPTRDGWAASLAELEKEFARGKIPRGATNQLDLFDNEFQSCRVCRF